MHVHGASSASKWRRPRCSRKRWTRCGRYWSDARSAAQVGKRNLGQKIVLLNGRQLAELMIQYGVGVGEEATYTLKRIDSDYFDPS